MEASSAEIPFPQCTSQLEILTGSLEDAMREWRV